MSRYKVEIKGLSPLILGKNDGNITDIQNMPDDKKCEKFCYRHKNGNLAIPTVNMKASLRDGYVYPLDNKTYKSKEQEFSQDISIESVDEDDLINIDLGVDNYSIFKRSVLIGRKRNGQIAKADNAVNPMLESWCCSFILDSRLMNSGSRDIRGFVDLAGLRVGVGTCRKLGYGRFKVVSFNEMC